MRCIAIIFLLIFCISSTFGQQRKETVKEKGKSAFKKALSERRDLIVFEFTFDNWFHRFTNGTKTQPYSFGVNSYFMYDFPLKKASRFSAAPGLGIGSSHIFLNAEVVDRPDRTEFIPLSTNFKRSRLSIVYFDIPFELRYRTKPLKGRNAFKVALGFKLGVRFSATWRITKEDPTSGHMKLFKERGFRDLGIVRFGPTLRLGYGFFNINAYYGAVELFKKNRGPANVHPFSLGISFNLL